MAAPSARTNPSRSLSNGRLALVGSEFLADRALITMNAPMHKGVHAASVPPATITSVQPRRRMFIASAIACPELAHAVAWVEAGPRRPYRIEMFPVAAFAINRGTVK